MVHDGRCRPAQRSRGAVHTYSGLGDGGCQAKKVSQFSRKEWIQWKKNVQTVDLFNGLFLTVRPLLLGVSVLVVG